MYKYFHVILVFIILFIGDNISNYFNIDGKYIMILIILLSIFIAISTKSYKNRRLEICTFIFVVLYTLFKIKTDPSEGARMTGLMILIPLLFLLSLPIRIRNTKQQYKWKIIGKLLSMFYIIECCIAIWERVSHTILFKANIDSNILKSVYETESLNFRSRAIHGHPLQNSLIVSTIMVFILTSTLKDKYKYPLWMLGFISIMCFNARAAIIVNGVVLILHFINLLCLKKGYNKAKYILLLFVLLLIGFYLLFVIGLGGRLITSELIDGSAQVRLDIWQIFNYNELPDFLFGLDYNALQLLLFKTDLYATENFYLDWMLRYGLVFLIPFLILFLVIIKKNLAVYKKINALLIFITFLGVASSNNSLSATYSATTIFYLCLVMFSPQMNRLWIKYKYLKKESS